MRILDLFCGAGGAAKGYADAGFEVFGIDNKKHDDYPFVMFVKDVMDLQPVDFVGFDAIHASPPCQPFTSLMKLAAAQGKKTNKVDLLEPTRDLLQKTNLPYVIENVVGAPLIDPIVVCGSAFDLGVRRHRLFESNLPLKGTICDHKKQGRPIGVYGSMNDEIPNGGRTAKTIEQAREAMGIDWPMKWSDLVEAIPPSYTKFVGLQLMEALNG